MGEHLVLCVDRLITPESVQTLQGGSSYSPKDHKVDIELILDEEKPLLESVECRICQEEDSLGNLEVPCACSGSVKFAHRKCVQRWCNEKGDITCEICHQPYQPGYTAPPPPSEDTDTDISPRWTTAGAQVDINDPRLVAIVERRLLETDNDDYADSSSSGAAFCRSGVLILIVLLLMRDAMSFGNGDGDAGDEEVFTFFSLFLLRAAGFLLPCYIVAWAISIIQRHRQRQEAATLDAAEVTFMVPAAGQHSGGLHVTITPGPTPALVPEVPTPHQPLL